jgi:hypothetical protein
MNPKNNDSKNDKNTVDLARMETNVAEKEYA